MFNSLDTHMLPLLIVHTHTSCKKGAFLSPLSNISQNPGCESFSLVFDEGYDSNINFGETLDLHIETCDLLPFVINPSNEAFS